MTPHPDFCFLPWNDEIRVHSIQTNCLVGRIQVKGPGHYRILDAEGEAIGKTDNLVKAVDALTTHYERRSRWRSDSPTEYFKCTLFGMIEVKQNEDRYWYVYRNSDHYLMRDGEVATFATLEEAQCAADLHVRDPRIDRPSSDGLSWYIQPKFPIYRKCVIADNAVANSS
jgi:hypothetical protein